jgi:hypothetical protein
MPIPLRLDARRVFNKTLKGPDAHTFETGPPIPPGIKSLTVDGMPVPLGLDASRFFNETLKGLDARTF